MPLYIILGIFMALLSSCTRKPKALNSSLSQNSIESVIKPAGAQDNSYKDNLDNNGYSLSRNNGVNDTSEKCRYPLFKDEARLLDIPFPINASSLWDLGNYEEDPRKIVIKFIIDQQCEDIIAFYRAEMECLGWYETAVIKGGEVCLLFQKPSRLCVIMIKSLADSNNNHEIVLFIAPNKFLV